MSGDPLCVAWAATGRYVAYSAAALHSVLAHAGGRDVRVLYLHDPRLPVGDRERLAATVEAGGGTIDFLCVDDARVAGLPADERFTAAMWHRLFLPELAPDVDRVLYLDVDTLAVDDLTPLWETDLDDHYVGAVTNILLGETRWRPGELGLAGPAAYFNSGVLLLNLAALRRDRCTEALLDVVAARGDALAWPDQDALNLVLGHRRLALHPRWNAMNALAFPEARRTYGRRARRAARRRPAIRHFEGPGANKPWDEDCRFPHRDAWRAHFAATPFSA